jgi:hypothetical protein
MFRTSVLCTVLALGVLAPAAPSLRATHFGAEVVVEWNQAIQDTVPVPHNVLTPRFFSMTHIAMFDAINAIDRDYTPYRFQGFYWFGGSPQAAAAQAGHDVMIALNPAGAATYDALLARQLGPSPSGYVARGAAIGARVAKDILEWRKNDGWIVSPFPPYVEPMLPGKWQPTPPNNPNPTFTHLQKALPMAIVSPTQFLPVPPPSLTSARYAADVNEIALIGKSDSGTRTPAQTEIARIWNGIGVNGTGTATQFMSIWNNIARDVSKQRGLSLIETARVFALMNVSVHDSLMTTQTSKFVYGMWRPVTAIRQADTDLNPATNPDPAWLPLLTTPPYPSYAGNFATIGASAARALRLAFGTNDVAFAATWKQSNGSADVSHAFDSFTDAADEMLESRVYGGIHYRFDQVAGQQVGISVADYVFTNYLRPHRWAN